MDDLETNEPVAARLPLRLQLSGARAALDGLQRDLSQVDRILSRLGDAPTNVDHPLHAFAVAVGPRFIHDGREFRLSITRLLGEIEELERKLEDAQRAVEAAQLSCVRGYEHMPRTTR